MPETIIPIRTVAVLHFLPHFSTNKPIYLNHSVTLVGLMFVLLIVIALATFVPSTQASCLPCKHAGDVAAEHSNVTPRTVYDPAITNPGSGAVWDTGSTVKVTW